MEETLPYLYALLGIEEQPSPLQQMDAQIRRRRTFDALKKLFLRESLNQPLILVFEDLHWIDGETQGYLDVLSESVAGAHLLLLVNYRPDSPRVGTEDVLHSIAVSAVGQSRGGGIPGRIVGCYCRGRHPVGMSAPGTGRTSGAPLHTLKQLILEKTEGTPFFMEEIVQELREQGRFTSDVGAGLALSKGQWREVNGGSGIPAAGTIKSTHEAKKTRPSLSGSSKS